MCAIVDANVSHQVFGPDRPEAGVQFLSWINSGSGRLVAGGKLYEELYLSGKGFREWMKQVIGAGKLIKLNDQQVEKRTAEIERAESTESDDAHILAVAQIGGARLLYSNGQRLHADFGKRDLIDKPRGKVYSTLINSDFTQDHRNLLRRSACRNPQTKG